MKECPAAQKKNKTKGKSRAKFRLQAHPFAGKEMSVIDFILSWQSFCDNTQKRLPKGAHWPRKVVNP